MGKITDVITENNRNILRLEGDEDRVIDEQSTQRISGVKTITFKTTTKKIIKDEDDNTISEETVEENKIGTKYARNLLIDILTDDDNDTPIEHRFGDGSTQNRRETESLDDDKTDELDITNDITQDGDKIIIKSEYPAEQDESWNEIGINAESDTLLQYLNP